MGTCCFRWDHPWAHLLHNIQILSSQRENDHLQNTGGRAFLITGGRAPSFAKQSTSNLWDKWQFHSGQSNFIWTANKETIFPIIHSSYTQVAAHQCLKASILQLAANLQQNLPAFSLISSKPKLPPDVEEAYARSSLQWIGCSICLRENWHV